MTLAKALELFAKHVSGRIPTGFWEKDGQYIINTKATFMTDGLTAPAQYVVTKSGEVYGTNPVNSNLDISKMKKFPAFRNKR